ncbi:putative response regulatory protein [Paraliobacillus sp. PM-2]|uniref:response regulator transcription factor n=1 Tax=Paraliobacillus sp. PM-2 TaxID=1462524 RepID=UPI00061C246E|nr:response regulator [Paraliobacillus sp. PM-2]CQR47308.1 putative response regulatory protein [Paraliobacillus sp. PM-2]
MLKVMIVDDMEIVRRQIKRLPLWGEHSNFSIVAEAEDGQDALEKLQQNSVDLLITDIGMPRINGVELLKEVQQKDLATCIVFLSEHSEFHFAKQAIEFGIFDYLVKPVSEEGLKKLLKKARSKIEEKRQVQTHIVNLENKLTEQATLFYPTTQFHSMIKLIKDGSEEALDLMKCTVEDTFTALDNDKMKTALLLEKFYNDLFTELIATYGWLGQFLNVESYVSISLTDCDTIEMMKEKLINRIDHCVSIINHLIFQSNSSPIVKQVCNYVLKNMDKEISMDSIAQELFLTKNYIGDLFKKQTGITVKNYIMLTKIEKAKQLLVNDHLKNYEIAHQLGYKNVEYFSKVFKKYTGYTPVAYKKIEKDR